ncbi:phosphatase PAP2 family protein [Membranihabitans marinus]|uniref:phosphatase PAP2 family protein n=1 Tax=Membranihabitans marinus TaxID=1227546 RepID=UPI001F25687C|nr:phosphatase PAP2 family protein [Membranihabitans marinus]
METLLNFDTDLFKLINGLDLGFLETVMVLFRDKYTWIPLYLLIIGYSIWRWKGKAWFPIAMMLVTLAFTDTASSQLIKKNVERKRPCQTMEVISRAKCGSGYSFTSSHATNHMGLAVFWFNLFGQWKGKRYLFILWALLIGFAQIFVGVHYPVDVFCGFILGGCLGWLSYTLYQKLYPKFMA